jgi:hypothetical protein
MAAPAPGKTEVILTQCQHNGVDTFIVKGVASQRLVEDLEISGQGDLGATAIATVGRRLNSTLTGCASLPVAVDAKGALVFTFTLADGTTRTRTQAAMKARGSTFTHQEKGEGMSTQDYKNESAYATEQDTAA